MDLSNSMDGLSEMARDLGIAVALKKECCQAETEWKPGITPEDRQPYYKVVSMGHIIQVYEMDRAPNLEHGRKEVEDLDPILSYEGISGNEDETKERNQKNREEWLEKMVDKVNRKEERRAQTLRDAKNNLKRLAICNFGNEDLFVTLTYPFKKGEKPFDDVDQGDKDLKAFVRKLRNETGVKVEYLAVREFTQNGTLHYHMMMTNCIPSGDLSDKEIRHWWEKRFGEWWKKGFVDIERMNRHRSKRKEFKDKPIDNVGAYLSKYFAKSAEDPRIAKRKAYLPSRGLTKPITYKGEEALEILKNTDLLDEKKIVFSNEYESDYLGQIKFKEYNLKR